ncbi:hypothetical protein NQZ68_005433 [Dissostichus eleginoides]|nr:hypothetical protein NQZ68_005433 [Dissostichus eleginoides]
MEAGGGGGKAMRGSTDAKASTDHPQGGCKLRTCRPAHLCLLTASTLYPRPSPCPLLSLHHGSGSVDHLSLCCGFQQSRPFLTRKGAGIAWGGRGPRGEGGAVGCPASGLPHRQQHTICSMLSVSSLPTSRWVTDSKDEQGEEHQGQTRPSQGGANE